MSVTQGAVPRFLDELGKVGGLKGTDIANITEVSKATVSRWKAGDIKPQPRTSLSSPTSITSSAACVSITPREEIRTWLYARHPQLNGERAIDLIHEDRTIEVLKVIDRLDSAAFV